MKKLWFSKEFQDSLKYTTHFLPFMLVQILNLLRNENTEAIVHSTVKKNLYS